MAASIPRTSDDQYLQLVQTQGQSAELNRSTYPNIPSPRYLDRERHPIIKYLIWFGVIAKTILSPCLTFFGFNQVIKFLYSSPFYFNGEIPSQFSVSKAIDNYFACALLVAFSDCLMTFFQQWRKAKEFLKPSKLDQEGLRDEGGVYTIGEPLFLSKWDGESLMRRLWYRIVLITLSLSFLFAGVVIFYTNFYALPYFLDKNFGVKQTPTVDAFSFLLTLGTFLAWWAMNYSELSENLIDSCKEKAVALTPDPPALFRCPGSLLYRLLYPFLCVAAFVWNRISNWKAFWTTVVFLLSSFSVACTYFFKLLNPNYSKLIASFGYDAAFYLAIFGGLVSALNNLTTRVLSLKGIDIGSVFSPNLFSFLWHHRLREQGTQTRKPFLSGKMCIWRWGSFFYFLVWLFAQINNLSEFLDNINSTFFTFVRIAGFHLDNDTPETSTIDSDTTQRWIKIFFIAAFFISIPQLAINISFKIQRILHFSLVGAVRLIPALQELFSRLYHCANVENPPVTAQDLDDPELTERFKKSCEMHDAKTDRDTDCFVLFKFWRILNIQPQENFVPNLPQGLESKKPLIAFTASDDDTALPTQPNLLAYDLAY